MQRTTTKQRQPVMRLRQHVEPIGTRRKVRPLDCQCDGHLPYCPTCLLQMACALRIAHPDTLSIAILKRRIPGISGREAAIVLEASKLYTHAGGREVWGL